MGPRLARRGRPRGHPDIDLQAVADTYDARTGGRVVIDEDGTAVVGQRPRCARVSGRRQPPEIATALDGEVASGTRHSGVARRELPLRRRPGGHRGEVHGGPHHLPGPRRSTSGSGALVPTGARGRRDLAAATVVGIARRSVTRPLRRLRTPPPGSATATSGGRTPRTRGHWRCALAGRPFNDTAAPARRAGHRPGGLRGRCLPPAPHP